MTTNPEVKLGNKRALARQVAALKKRDATQAIIKRTPLTDLPKVIAKLQANAPQRTREERQAYHWQTEIIPHLRASQLPRRFWYEATEWKPQQRQTLKDVKALLLGKGAIIALVGARGLGKTTIAGQLILERAKDETLLPWHRRPPYRKLAKLIAQFKALYADFGTIDAEYLLRRHDDLCRDHPLVIIDELHDCDDLRIKNRLLTDTLDKRYGNLIDTILISNQTPEEFEQTTSDSVLSRLKEHGEIFHCTWDSWR